MEQFRGSVETSIVVVNIIFIAGWRSVLNSSSQKAETLVDEFL